MWNAIGIFLTVALAAFAWHQSRSHSFYAADVYGMTTRSHRRFALLALAFTAGFFLAIAWPLLTVPLLALFTIAAVLYATSFARGYADEDE